MLLLAACPPFIWPDQHREHMANVGEGGWQLLFWPEINAGPCGGPTWCCQTVEANNDGSFEATWGSELYVEGVLGDDGFEASLTCTGDWAAEEGWIVADQVDSHYQGEFQFGASFGAVMVVPVEPATVSLQGMVWDGWNSVNVAGARVTASVDPDSVARTNDAGMFYLVTGAAKEYGATPYTITIEADGYAPWAQEGIWGDQPVYLLFELTPSGEGSF